jgi:hypothetical protein
MSRATMDDPRIEQDGWKLAETAGAGAPPRGVGLSRTDRRAYACTAVADRGQHGSCTGLLKGGELGEDRRAEIGMVGGECPRATAGAIRTGTGPREGTHGRTRRRKAEPAGERPFGIDGKEVRRAR